MEPSRQTTKQIRKDFASRAPFSLIIIEVATIFSDKAQRAPSDLPIREDRRSCPKPDFSRAQLTIPDGEGYTAGHPRPVFRRLAFGATCREFPPSFQF